MADPTKDKSTFDQKPPLFKSWIQVYVFVMAVFGVLVTLFYLFTKIFS